MIDSRFDILAFFCYLPSGSFMQISGIIAKMSKTASFRAVHKVMDFLVIHFNEYVKFPEDLSTIKRHVKIQSPSRIGGERFRNRKGYFSVNVQAICSMDLIFWDVVVRLPGSTHDSRIGL